MNKEKIRDFFKKLNNSYVIAAICVILIGIILLGAMIGLVARPYSTNTTYSATVHGSGVGTMKIKLVLLDDGRYSQTVKYVQLQEISNTFGDYAFRCGKYRVGENKGQSFNHIYFDGDYDNTFYELKNPFKIEFYGVELTNVGGIFLLVCYCILICFAAAIVTILLIKRKDGGVVFTNRMRLIKRLRELEQMLGVTHETNTEE